MLKIDEHENRINELIGLLKVDGVDQAKASTIIQSLRDNYTEVTTSITDNTKKLENVNQLNEGLRSANMMLLSKLGTPEPKAQDTKPQDPKPTEVKSLDDIANEFLK